MNLDMQRRIYQIRTTPLFDFPQFKRARTSMRWVHRQPHSDRPCNVYIPATNGMGKTTLVRQFLKEEGIPQDDFGNVSVVDGRASVLVIDLTKLSDARTLNEVIAAAATGGAELKYKDAKSSAHGYLHALGVKTIILDEFSDLRRHTLSFQKKYLSQLRSIANERKIGFIALGIYSPTAAFGAEPSLLSRFTHCDLKPWKVNDDLRSFATSIAGAMLLRHGFDINHNNFYNLLVRHSEGETGRLVSAIRGSGMHAILSGHERLDIETLKAYIADPFPEGCDGDPA